MRLDLQLATGQKLVRKEASELKESKSETAISGGLNDGGQGAAITKRDGDLLQVAETCAWFPGL